MIIVEKCGKLLKNLLILYYCTHLSIVLITFFLNFAETNNADFAESNNMNKVKTNQMVARNHILMLTFLLSLLAHAWGYAATGQQEREWLCVLGGSGVGGVVQDSRGLIWIATWNGLCCTDGYDIHAIKLSPGDGTDIGGDHIRDICLSPQGMIWCHTDDEVFEFNPYTFAFRDLPKSTQDSIAPQMGKTWQGLRDIQNVLWTADEHGLYKTIPLHHPARVIDGSQGMHPRAMNKDSKGNIWVGFKADNSIKVYSQDGKLLRSMSAPFSPYCLLEAADGVMWAGGKPGGLMRVGGNLLTQDPVYDIRQDKLGRLWIATFGNGIKCCLNPADDNPRFHTFCDGKKVRQILITTKGNLIAATTEGLIVGDISKSDIKTISLVNIKRDGHNPNSLMSNAVMNVVSDSQHRIFIATESSGIDMVEEDILMSDQPVFTHLTMTSRSLSREACKALTMCGDSLLVIVGDDNVSFYNPLNDNAIRYASSFWTDSCRFAEVAPMRMSDGSWWVCSLSGLLRATPHHLYTRGFVPPLIFTTLSINGGSELFRVMPDTLRLNANERNISLEFAAINHIDNTNILYRSSFDGSPWTAACPTRRVSLYDLTPGWHTIRIQSTDSYGRWVDNTCTMDIYVAPYWHETWWAMTLLILIVVSILAAITYGFIYIRMIKRQKSQLLEQLMAMINHNNQMVFHEQTLHKTGEVRGESIGEIVGEVSSHEYCQDGSTDVMSVTPDNQDASVNKLHDSIIKAKPEDVSFLNNVRHYIEINISNSDANIEDMASFSAVSRSTLNRRLRSLVGISATQLLIEARMQRAQELIASNAYNLYTMTEIADKCGYADVNYFKAVIKKRGIEIS